MTRCQWLCNADFTGANPYKRLNTFFSGLYHTLKRGAKAVLQWCACLCYMIVDVKDGLRCQHQQKQQHQLHVNNKNKNNIHNNINININVSTTAATSATVTARLTITSFRYPENAHQMEMITASAMRCGFTGGMVVDFPNSTKVRALFTKVFVPNTSAP